MKSITGRKSINKNIPGNDRDDKIDRMLKQV